MGFSKLKKAFGRRCFLMSSVSVGLWASVARARDGKSDFRAPRYFTSRENAFVQAAARLIYPRDDQGAGADELNVAEYIDVQMTLPYGYGARQYLKAPFFQGPVNLGYQLPYTPRELYRTAIEAIDAFTVGRFGRPFVDLTPDNQIRILEDLQDGKLPLDGIGMPFFEMLRANVLEGVFADPLYGGNVDKKGWLLLGFPGARADFMEWINQNGAPYPFGPVSIGFTLSQMIAYWRLNELVQK